MRDGRFRRNYGRRRSRRRWRIRSIRQAAGKRELHLRGILLPILAAEALYGVWYLAATSGYEIHLVRVEEAYQIEWHEKNVGEKNAPEKNARERDVTPDKLYGIRLRPGKLEVEFYQGEPVEPSPEVGK